MLQILGKSESTPQKELGTARERGGKREVAR